MYKIRNFRSQSFPQIIQCHTPRCLTSLRGVPNLGDSRGIEAVVTWVYLYQGGTQLMLGGTEELEGWEFLFILLYIHRYTVVFKFFWGTWGWENLRGPQLKKSFKGYMRCPLLHPLCVSYLWHKLFNLVLHNFIAI